MRTSADDRDAHVYNEGLAPSGPGLRNIGLIQAHRVFDVFVAPGDRASHAGLNLNVITRIPGGTNTPISPKPGRS